MKIKFLLAYFALIVASWGQAELPAANSSVTFNNLTVSGACTGCGGNLPPMSGSTQGGYVTNNGTSASWSKPWLDVAGFGVFPGTQNTTNINNAIAACNGGVLYFPPGIYTFTGVINVNVACFLVGFNQAATIQKGATGALITLTANNTGIQGLTLDGNSGAFGGGGVQVNNASNVDVIDNTVKGVATTAQIYLNGSGGSDSNIRVLDNVVTCSSTADGIFGENGLNHVTISRNFVDCSPETAGTGTAHTIAIHTTTAGVDMNDIIVSENQLKSPGGSHAGFCLEIGTFVANGVMPHNVSVHDNRCDLTAASIGGYSFWISNSSVANNSYWSNGFTGVNSAFESVFTEHTSFTGNTISCDVPTAGPPVGWSLDTTNFNTYSGNTICNFTAAASGSGMHIVQSHANNAISSWGVSGNTYTITTTGAYNTSGEFTRGAWVNVSGSAGGCDGLWQVQSNPSVTTLTVTISTASQTCTGGNIGGSSSHNVISGNQITFPQTTAATLFGILIQCTQATAICNGNVITGNHIDGNASGGGQQAIAISASAGTSDSNFIANNIIRGTSTGIQTNANVTNTFIGPQTMTGVTTKLNASVSSLQASALATTFATLATCVAGLEGNTAVLTDVTTATWNTTVVGLGGNHLRAGCNGTNWVTQ